MNKSEAFKELPAAMAKAQAKIEGATKDKLNPHFRSKYADLSSVVEAIKKPLSEAGLCYTQILHDAPDSAKVETIILHSSGEWLSCGVISVPVSKLDAQGYGSALTYARRYSLSAAFGVAPEDDDGNLAAAAKPGLPSKPINPGDGSLAALTPEDQTKAKKIASSVVDLWEQDKQIAAYELVYEGGHENDFILGIWEVLRPFSKIRNELKKMHQSHPATAQVSA